jgi:spore coat protein U-like protein
MHASPRCQRVFLLGLLVGLLIAPRAHAVVCGTVLDPISVTASTVAFGTYDPLLSSARLANGNVRIACGLGVDVLPSFVVRLSRGQSASYAPRYLKSGITSLAYNLYTTAALATVWGDGSAGTSVRSISGTLLVGSINLPVYGAIAPGQLVRAGTYTDTITVTVEY